MSTHPKKFTSSVLAPKWRRDRVKVEKARIVASIVGSALQDDPLLNSEQAAAYLSLKPSTLAAWRCYHPNRLAFLRVGKAVRYRKSTLDQYLKSCEGVQS
jgi:excisionase family DNA binding protein